MSEELDAVPVTAGADEGEAALENLKKRLADPKVQAGLNQLLNNAELLGFLVESGGQLLARSPEMMENAAEIYQMANKMVSTVTGGESDLASLKEDGAALAKVVPEAMPLARKAIDEGILTALANSSMFNPEVIDVLTIVTKALSHASIEVQEQHELLSPWALLWRLRDPDLNRALRFATTMLTQLGKELDPKAGNFRPRKQTQ